MKQCGVLTRKLCASVGNRSLQRACAASTMPPCDFKPEPYTGIRYEDAMKVRKENLSPTLLTFYKKPVMIHQGYMQWLYDTDGKRYLDLFAGIVTVSVGHCHPKVNAAAEKQMKMLWHTTNIYMHPAIHEYGKKLADKMPGNLKVIYFANSGSEANDLAVLMARMHTGVFDIVSLRNAYHGGSPYLMGLTALSSWKFNCPTGFGMHQTMNPDPFRGLWDGKHCRDSPSQYRRHVLTETHVAFGCSLQDTGFLFCLTAYLCSSFFMKMTVRDCDCAAGECKAGDMYVDQLEDVLRYSLPKGRCGAFFAESIQVQTGFGRTGTHYWGFEGHDVIPDIVCMAKGIGNGYPMTAVVTNPEIAASMGKALHFNTFGGNPVAIAVGSAVLDVIDEEKIQQNSHVVGTYFIEELAKLRDQFEIVGDVRGKGLMIGIEMVKDKASREPLAAEKFADIWEDMKDDGVLMGDGGLYGNVFRVKPPICITKEDVDFAISVFRDALQKHSNN